MAEPRDRAFVDARMTEVFQWCSSSEAAATAKRILRRKRLTLAPEDLVVEAQARVLQAIHRQPANFDEFNPAAYCTRVMANVVKGLLAHRGATSEVPSSDTYQWVAATEEPTPSHVDHGDVHRYCAVVEALGTHPIHVSGALTLTYLTAFTDIAIDDAPWPKAGVVDGRRQGWPALWYATRSSGLFPASGRHTRDGQARTRQRYLDKIDALRVHARALLAGEDPS